jgi:hypothetical protein
MRRVPLFGVTLFVAMKLDARYFIELCNRTHAEWTDSKKGRARVTLKLELTFALPCKLHTRMEYLIKCEKYADKPPKTSTKTDKNNVKKSTSKKKSGACHCINPKIKSRRRHSFLHSSLAPGALRASARFSKMKNLAPLKSSILIICLALLLSSGAALNMNYDRARLFVVLTFRR